MPIQVTKRLVIRRNPGTQHRLRSRPIKRCALRPRRGSDQSNQFIDAAIHDRALSQTLASPTHFTSICAPRSRVTSPEVSLIDVSVPSEGTGGLVQPVSIDFAAVATSWEL